MIILFEEYAYKTVILKQVLSERYFVPINSDKSKINFVGYYFNSFIKDSVIIFPKVFIDENGLAFNEFLPDVLIKPSNEIKYKLSKSGKDKLIFEISTWLFRGIQQFNKRKFRNSISENQYLNQVVSNLKINSNTELDIILSLLKFYKENQAFFTFISKSAHAQNRKINWQKTITKVQPYIKNNIPFYLNLITTKNKINYEEDLLIIFYSTLNFIKNKYAFDFSPPQNYELIKGNKFEILLQKGCRILKDIKYKYYSDKMISLYNLLYSFFERSAMIQSKNLIEEVLLIKEFNIVFEDMIDDLIGDDKLLPELKNHPDGKQIDHIYRYKSLIIEDDVYFVGDSKYYKPKNSIGKYSQAKQFTYAKNVIQYNIDLFNSDKLDKQIRYRDNLTEGYNITPNFFISAIVNQGLDFSHPNLEATGKPIYQIHFENRLFDRDTLFVQYFNINFLFVLSAYLTNNSMIKKNFKKETQKMFRTKLINFLNEKYIFYKLVSKSNFFIEKYFKLLIGKIYKPNNINNEFILALEKPDKTSILSKIEIDIESKIEYKLT